MLTLVIVSSLLTQSPTPTASTTLKVPFGTAGNLVWTSGTTIRFSASAPMLASRPAGVSDGRNPSDDFSGEAVLALAMDYFAWKRLSVGAFVRAGYTWSQTAYGPGFGIGPRIGYNIPFADWVSVWPRLELSFGGQGSFVRPQTAATATPAAPGTQTMVWFFNAAAHFPLTFAILEHVVLGVGPYFSLEPQWVSGQAELGAFALNFGLSSFIGWHY